MSDAGSEYPTAQSFTPLRRMDIPSDLSVFDMTPEEDEEDYDDESKIGAEYASTTDEITAHEDADEANAQVPAPPNLSRYAYR
ncbi:MAG TPA: hypothetical protein VGO07_06105 [Candidatus Saccharimonadales bacterium]|jgi:hypothetical protein|nr:hypothetical protein [Candidatus Saccharimonadales bacterium]